MQSTRRGERALQLVLPVYNEAASIEAVIREILAKALSHDPAALVVCEDGSHDETPRVLAALQHELGFTLHSSPHRKGYALAVLDGLKHTDADYVLCLDSDGQYDPTDLKDFWAIRDPDTVIAGYRTPRRDPGFRLVCSKVFSLFFSALYPSRRRDPSCPMVLIPRRILNSLIPRIRLMREAFWWEFSAHCWLAGYPVRQIPIHHRLRLSGDSSIFRPLAMPGIFWRNLKVLLSLRFGRIA